MSGFAHLHCHSEFSFYKSIIQINALCEQASALQMPAVAITDDSGLYGAVDLHTQAMRYGLIPILGCEIFVEDKRRSVSHPYPLVLLAKHREGYENLTRIVTASERLRTSGPPRVDKELLSHYCDGLIALSGGFYGEISRMLEAQDMDTCLSICKEYAKLFQNNFYVELVSPCYSRQKTLNIALQEIAEAAKLPVVATADCRSLFPNEERTLAVLRCLGMGTKLSDISIYDMSEFWFKPEELMRESFSFAQNAVDNACEIVMQCRAYNLKNAEFRLPRVPISHGRTPYDELNHLARRGLAQRLSKLSIEKNTTEYIHRLDFELKHIKDAKLENLFCIVHNVAKKVIEHGDSLGSNCGDSVGSLVLWALKVTDIDPLAHGLQFESFFNPLLHREQDLTLAINVDIENKLCFEHGQLHIAKTAAFSRLESGELLQKVTELLNQPRDDENYETILNIEKLARQLDGVSVGVSDSQTLVISENPIEDYCACSLLGNRQLTQCDRNGANRLGLQTIETYRSFTQHILDECINTIWDNYGDLTLQDIPLDDQDTWALFYAGRICGLPHVENTTYSDTFKRLKPDRLLDLAICIGLDSSERIACEELDQYILRKNQCKIAFGLPPHDIQVVASALSDTYGVPFFQEQLITLAHNIAGFSISEGERFLSILRKEVLKKSTDNQEFLVSLCDRYVNAAQRNGVNRIEAEQTFNVLMRYTPRVMLKSLALGKALDTWRAAYLKTHYPAEYMTTLLNETCNEVKRKDYLEEAKSIGVRTKFKKINIKNKELKLIDVSFFVSDGTILAVR